MHVDIRVFKSLRFILQKTCPIFSFPLDIKKKFGSYMSGCIYALCHMHQVFVFCCLLTILIGTKVVVLVQWTRATCGYKYDNTVDKRSVVPSCVGVPNMSTVCSLIRTTTVSLSL